jgi:hypothetical protein
VCDDGDRTELTNKAYGANLIATLRGLKKDGRLSTTDFPALPSLLKNAAEWGEAMKEMGCDSPYYIVCKGIGKRLFGGKEVEMKVEEKRWIEEWVEGLGKDERESVRAGMKQDEEEREEDEKPWYARACAGDEDDKDPDYALTRVWKEYKDYLVNTPTMPMRGPMIWDISKWSEEEKREFSFDNMDSDF